MFERIMVPLDGSELAVRILLQLRRLLQAGERVSLLLVVDPGRLSEREVEEEVKGKGELGERLRLANQDLSRYLDELVSAGVEADGEVLVGKPAQMILSQARLSELSLIAMGTHGRGGIGRWVRGSVAERVLRGCPVPLLLVNPREEDDIPDEPFKTILVPLDGSERSAAVLPLVSRFARVHDSQVVLLRVSDPLPAGGYPDWGIPIPSLSEADLLESLEPYRAQLVSEGVTARSEGVFEGSVSDGILDAVAREQADLVAMSTHGRSGLDRWLFGSVAEKISRHCPVPLLIQRDQESGAD